MISFRYISDTLGYVGDPAKYDVEEAQAYVPEWCRMMAEAIAGFLRREEHRK